MKRRVLLASTAALAALSGCFSSEEPGETRLAGLVIRTDTRESTTVDLHLEWEDEVVLDSTYDIYVDEEEEERRGFYEGPIPERRGLMNRDSSQCPLGELVKTNGRCSIPLRTTTPNAYSWT